MSYTIALLGNFLVLILLLAGCAFFELKEHRLPNVLTLPALVLGLCFAGLPGGLSLQSSLLGAGLGFSVLYAVYSVGGLGAGDVKLMTAVGSLIGYPLIVSALVCTAVLGGVMALFVLISRREVAKGFSRMALVFQPGGASKLADTSDTLPALPYGMAIIGGSVLSLFWGGLI